MSVGGVRLAALLLLAAAVGGCFESGPLGQAADPGPADPGWVLDPGPTPDPGGPSPDPGAPDPGAPDPGSADAGTACLTDGECAALQTADLCAGLVRCIDNVCQPDPATVVSCESSDPCIASTCDPTTGQCVTTTLCGCEPVGNLACFGQAAISTADPGATNVMGGYPCGPAGGAGPEHTWVFSTDETTQVKLDVQANDSGGVWVLGYNGTSCVTEACVAGGTDSVTFEAIAGFKYAVVFEHPEGGMPTAVTVTPLCGVAVEAVCNDGIDDDNNGLTDCEDSACFGVGACPSGVETLCTDGVDDDADGQTDCDDPDCGSVLACLQPCESSLNVSCGFSQGLGTGGGKAQATDYSCGPAAGGKEVVYRFTHSQFANVTATLETAVGGMGVYVMQETGKGCTPTDCIAYGAATAAWSNVPGTVYYLSVDAPEGVSGSYGLTISCN